jgi:D-glycero-D-manno-heptose 1,7-bisphosphate phosphatase
LASNLIYQNFTELGSQLKALVLVDRDNTLINDTGYFHSVDEISYIPSTLDVLQKISKDSVAIIIVSNQGGIGLKKFTFDDSISVNERIYSDLGALGISISGAAFCPHTKHDECFYRKPKTGMIDFCLKLSGLTRNRVFFLGDQESDRKSASSAGINFGWTQSCHVSKELEMWIEKIC